MSHPVCLSVCLLVTLSDFQFVSVSGRPAWKVEERGPQFFNFRILAKFHNFGQISEFQLSFRISAKFQDFGQMSEFSPKLEFWLNFRIIPKCIFAKCNRVACLLSFASFFYTGFWEKCTGICYISGSEGFQQMHWHMWCRTSTFGGRGNCLDCCINNICQLACVCPLPWEFSQPEESRDCALAEGGREKLFQKKDNNVLHFTCKDYSVDSRRAKYGILHPYNLHHGGVVLCASICPPSPVWGD